MPKFAGWLAVYGQGTAKPKRASARSSRRRQRQAGATARTTRRTACCRCSTEGQTLTLRELRPEQKFTQPPPRFNEGSLVKALEENGIGRPSTYASIIGVLQARDYVNKIEGRVPADDPRASPRRQAAAPGVRRHPRRRVHRADGGPARRASRRARPTTRTTLSSVLQGVQEGPEARGRRRCRTSRKGSRPARRATSAARARWSRRPASSASSWRAAAIRTATTRRNSSRPKRRTEELEESCENCGKPMVRQARPLRHVPGVHRLSRVQDHAEDHRDQAGRERPPSRIRSSTRSARTAARTSSSSRDGSASSPPARGIPTAGTSSTRPPASCARRTAATSSSASRGAARCSTAASTTRSATSRCGTSPVAEPCPKCGAPFLTEKITKRHGRQLICSNEECDYVRSEELAERRRQRQGRGKSGKAGVRRGRDPRFVTRLTSTPALCPAMKSVHIIGGGLAGCEAAWQAASRGRAGHRSTRCGRSADGRPPDRPAGRTGLQQLVPRRQARQRRRPAEGRDAAARLARHARGRPGARAGRRGAGGRSRAVRRGRDARDSRAIRCITRAARGGARACRRRRRRRAGDHRDRPADVGRAVGRHRRASSAATHLAFFDAISPIVLAETIDMSKVFRQSRWDEREPPDSGDRPARRPVPAVAERSRVHRDRRTGLLRRVRANGADRCGDYLNCPFTRTSTAASTRRSSPPRRPTVHDFDNTKFFEGCLPIEVMAHRGRGHAAVRSDEAGGPDRSAHGPLAVRRGPAAAGQPGRRSLQPRRLPDAAEVGRAGARVADDSRPRAGRVRAVRHDSPQHLHQRSDGAAATRGRRARGRTCSSPARCRASRATWSRRRRG